MELVKRLAGFPQVWHTECMDKTTDYTKGQRVQIHPAADAWMSGDRFGTIERVGRKYLSVRMDRSGHLLMFAPRNILEVVTQ